MSEGGAGRLVGGGRAEPVKTSLEVKRSWKPMTRKRNEPETLVVENVPAFVACLTLGTLEAIRAGAMDAADGIWTLGAPRTWEPLERDRRVPPELLRVLKTGDEIDAAKTLLGPAYVGIVDELKQAVLGLIETRRDKIWRLTWLRDASTRRVPLRKRSGGPPKRASRVSAVSRSSADGEKAAKAPRRRSGSRRRVRSR